MIRTERRLRAAHQPSVHGERRRGVRLGVLAGVLGIGCCVAPAAAALLGLTSAAAAVDLGNRLYGEWGWAFKGAALAFAGAALWVQRRRARCCPAERRPDLRRSVLWVAGVGLGTYVLLYLGTKALSTLA